MECCVNKLGIFPHNEIIDTGIQTGMAGEHKLYINAANGSKFILTMNLLIADVIKIAVGVLNESMAYNFKIQLPDETFYALTDCENFFLQTIINTQIDGCIDPCEPDTNNYYGYGY